MLSTTPLRLSPLRSVGRLRPIRSPCPTCGRASALAAPPAALFGARSGSTSASPRSRSRRLYPLALVIALPTLFFWQKGQEGTLSPERYTDLAVQSVEPLGPQHVQLTVPLDAQSRRLFSDPPAGTLGAGAGAPAEVVVQHVMLKSPDLQIERAYTPLGDAAREGALKLVVKRVKGGEVGRMARALRPGDMLGIRGPIITLSIIPEGYDKIVMISSGTGVAPFLQLLNKLPPSSASSVPEGKFHLVHLATRADKVDWAVTSDALPAVERRLGKRLSVTRPLGPDVAALQGILAGSAEERDRTLVLVCLSPNLMKPLCGLLEPNFNQGPVTGLLADLGMSSRNVWKLE